MRGSCLSIKSWHCYTWIAVQGIFKKKPKKCHFLANVLVSSWLEPVARNKPIPDLGTLETLSTAELYVILSTRSYSSEILYLELYFFFMEKNLASQLSQNQDRVNYSLFSSWRVIHKVVYLPPVFLKTHDYQLVILLSMLLAMLLMIKLHHCMKI